MAITTFIPNVWAETLNRSLNQEYVGVAHCTRDYEGEIKSCGSSVRIFYPNRADIFEYVPGQDLRPPQFLSASEYVLTIERAKYFNFLIDDVNRVQLSPHLMSGAMQSAANALAVEADRYVFSLAREAGAHLECILPTPETVLDPIYEARTLLMKAGVNDLSQVVLEVSPEVANILLKSKMLISHDNTAILETGSIGMVLGIPVFVSNNIFIEGEGGIARHLCVMRTRRAVAFAEQISEIEAYRPDKYFADAVKGLHLYGAAILCPEEMIKIAYQFSTF